MQSSSCTGAEAAADGAIDPAEIAGSCAGGRDPSEVGAAGKPASPFEKRLLAKRPPLLGAASED